MTKPADVSMTSGAHVSPFEVGCQIGRLRSASFGALHSTRSSEIETWRLYVRLPVA
jgi:hypothetical protein